MIDLCDVGIIYNWFTIHHYVHNLSVMYAVFLGKQLNTLNLNFLEGVSVTMDKYVAAKKMSSIAHDTIILIKHFFIYSYSMSPN